MRQISLEKEEFLSRHPVFTFREYVENFRGQKTESTCRTEVKKAVASGRLLNTRRGVYAVVPPGYRRGGYMADPYLLASKLGRDTVLAYHTALEILGHAQSVFHTYYYLSSAHRTVLEFQGATFRQVAYPKVLKEKGATHFGVITVERLGMTIKLTGRERTLVDCLDALHYAGGFEELARSVEGYPYVDFEQVLAYLELLGKPSLYAKVGYLLDLNRERFRFDETVSKTFRDRLPRAPVYLGRRNRGTVLNRGWNLLIPERLLPERWQEG